MVRTRGLEPPQDCSHYHLKVARLPFRHVRSSSGRTPLPRFAYSAEASAHGYDPPLKTSTVAIVPWFEVLINRNQRCETKGNIARFISVGQRFERLMTTNCGGDATTPTVWEWGGPE